MVLFWDRHDVCEASSSKTRSKHPDVGNQKVKCLSNSKGKMKQVTQGQYVVSVALLCLIVNRSEGKQGSGPEGDEVL